MDTAIITTAQSNPKLILFSLTARIATIHRYGFPRYLMGFLYLENLQRWISGVIEVTTVGYHLGKALTTNLPSSNRAMMRILSISLYLPVVRRDGVHVRYVVPFAWINAYV